MPVPSSATVMIAWDRISRSVTDTWPPAGVNFTAFDRRFHTTCCSRAASPAIGPPASSDVVIEICFAEASCRTVSTASDTIDATSTFWFSSRSLPATMRLMSSRSEISCAWTRVLRATTSRPRSRILGSSRPRIISSVHDRMALSGVLSSCDTIARNSSFTRLARSASRARRALGLEEALAFGDGALLLRDVARDLRRADHAPDPAPDRRDGERDLDVGAVLPPADRLEMIDAARPGECGREDGRLLRRRSSGIDQRDGPSDGFRGG